MPRAKKINVEQEQKEAVPAGRQEKISETTTIHQVPSSSAIVLKIPKPNAQIVVLSLVAVITLFQTFQLMKISSASSTVVKTAPAASTSTHTSAGTDANTPQSMVGGC